MTTRIDRGLPFDRYEIKEITFISPDENLRVFHTLRPERPTDVGYLILRNDGGGHVYDPTRDDPTAAWTRDYLVLRTSRAPSTVVLLLVLWRPGATR